MAYNLAVIHLKNNYRNKEGTMKCHYQWTRKGFLTFEGEIIQPLLHLVLEMSLRAGVNSGDCSCVEQGRYQSDRL